jgi:hypothetical protein
MDRGSLLERPMSIPASLDRGGDPSNAGARGSARGLPLCVDVRSAATNALDSLVTERSCVEQKTRGSAVVRAALRTFAVDSACVAEPAARR